MYIINVRFCICRLPETAEAGLLGVAGGGDWLRALVILYIVKGDKRLCRLPSMSAKTKRVVRPTRAALRLPIPLHQQRWRILDAAVRAHA